ncbi:MAG: hypothetical protein K1X70_20815 [Leptospirales bacterium]|nr:hypothetical protein [Leptospirales bacterium]
MKLLIDTNVFIPLEPAGLSDLSVMTPSAAEFLRRAQEGGHAVYYHPIIDREIQSDRNAERRELRQRLLAKYIQLPHAPALSDRVVRVLGPVPQQSHDWVDHHLLSAIERDAADFLITEDKDIHRKARNLGFADRVFSVVDAVAYLVALLPVAVPSHTDVTECLAHELDENDPIFMSFRLEYEDFDHWLQKVKRDHRVCYTIKRQVGGLERLAALSILKDETVTDFALRGSILKICSFKVSGDFSGIKLGELLLNTILTGARARRADFVYVTILPSHPELIDFMEEFGFSVQATQTSLGERILVKRLNPDPTLSVSSLQFHVLFGPGVEKLEASGVHIVPIQPHNHDLLFPSRDAAQPDLFIRERPYGNAIRKAYLCHARSRRIHPGDILLFYRSQDLSAINVVGVAEATIVSSNAEEVAKFAGLRTVYSFREIQEMCKKTVLSILFRFSRTLDRELGLNELKDAKILSGAPQSITELKGEKSEWIKKRIT